MRRRKSGEWVSISVTKSVKEGLLTPVFLALIVRNRKLSPWRGKQAFCWQVGPAPNDEWSGCRQSRRGVEPRQVWEMGEQSRNCPSPVSVGHVGTRFGIPAESAGKGMKPPVEDPAVSGKTDRGASQDLVSSSEGGVWE